MNPQLYGLFFGLSAFALWGFLPVYWKQMQGVPPLEILCHRIVWSCVFLFITIGLQKRWKEVSRTVNTPSSLKGLLLSGLIIGSNWFIYIWAVNSGRVVETSLGYYINPMINVLLGYLLLSESFSRTQFIALCFAMAGVLYSLVAYGALPYFALTLSVSFAFYGYARKKIQVKPIPGLFIETLVLFLPATAYIFYGHASGNSMFLGDTALTLWMIGSGLVTSLPLLCFAQAAKLLPLSTLGILQYLAPTIAFLLGVFVYGEPFSQAHLITFACIWAGVFLYTWDSLAQGSKGQ